MHVHEFMIFSLFYELLDFLVNESKQSHNVSVFLDLFASELSSVSAFVLKISVRSYLLQLSRRITCVHEPEFVDAIWFED